MAEQFYLVLPSDSSRSVYGQQSAAEFRTCLAKEVRCDGQGEWEMGMTELSYPRNWLNTKDCSFVLSRTNEDGSVTTRSGRLAERRCEDGVELTEALYKAVNKELGSGRKSEIRVLFKEGRNRVEIRVNDNYELELNGTLALLTGFGHRSKMTLRAGVHESPHVPNPHRNHLALHLYCDLAEHSLVGDVSAPLLKIVTDDGRSTDDVETVRFNPVQYVGVGKYRFDTVHCRICDRFGENVSFQGGRTVITLHFKRK